MKGAHRGDAPQMGIYNPAGRARSKSPEYSGLFKFKPCAKMNR